MNTMNFDLPPTGTEQSPAFLDAPSCLEWLATVPLANAMQAQTMLRRQLSLLHRFSLPATERFAILEVLRGPLSEVQGDAAVKFAGRPLPLVPHEQAALETTLSIWHELALGYLRCFNEVCGDMTDPAALEAMNKQCAESRELAVRAATLAQRTMAVFADWQLDFNRGGQLPDGSYWQKLHQIFFAAESLGVAGRSVHDTMRHGKRVAASALAAYAECNLLSTASVYELQARHLTWVARWAKRWGSKLSLLSAPPEDIRNRAIPLWVDLESDGPPSYIPKPSPGSRWLETTELRKSLVARISLLEQGRAPADLQLGDDVTQPGATQLLQRVLERWCKGGAERRQERQPANTACSLVAGFDAVHFELSGRQPFRAPSRSDSDLRREREEFETFGDRSQRTKAAGDKDEIHIERWQLVEESMSGLRATRPLKDGARIGPGLVVAAKVADGSHYVLGNVRWVLREGDNSLMAGIQLFPGVASPIAVRMLDSDGSRAVWRQGFLLPPIPALHETASVIVPAGTFRIDRSIEIMADQKLQVLKLFRVIDRGIEFERCNFYD